MAGKGPKKKKEAPMLVIQSKVKEYLAENHEVRSAGGMADALSEEVMNLLDRAAERCKDNNRQTVRAGDL